MKKIIILSLITFLFSLKTSSAQQTYDCIYSSGRCLTVHSCTSPCTSPTLCSAMSQQQCGNGPFACDCSQQLDLPALYRIIQPGNILFSFRSDTPGAIITSIVRYVFPIFGLLLLLYLLYGGYNLMLSGGDPKKAQAAKSILTTAFIGFVIIFTAYWIVQIIASIFGLTDITGIFG